MGRKSVSGVIVRKLTSCVSGALFPLFAISGLSGLVVECLSVVSAFDFSSQMSIQQELLGTALLTRIRLLRQELLGKEALFLLSVQNLFAQSLTYLYWMPVLERIYRECT